MVDAESKDNSTEVLDVFAEAEALRLQGDHQQALILLLKGLSKDSQNDQARLLLARVLYELNCLPFAVQEIQTLYNKHPESKSLARLLSSLGGHARSNVTKHTEAVMAESEIDFDAIDDLEQEL
jgi:tetratricopeptide (TPR) repeat protein